MLEVVVRQKRDASVYGRGGVHALDVQLTLSSCRCTTRRTHVTALELQVGNQMLVCSSSSQRLSPSLLPQPCSSLAADANAAPTRHSAIRYARLVLFA